ncbi:hypothetical protein EXIGLDRAFT_766338 [Exidia glandulosa HHB12029]|uniref:Uncharacterized protein n=1 Tax=Exidia glandulosa HHB12029 TaxID=1314781 RepID=A0A165JTY7_EXIGL|nr:hypothetical protein EXIGLDRAFT_766338 [Exidia glandulosa HHB12029]
MLRDLCLIVHRIKTYSWMTTITDDDIHLGEFISSLIILCSDLSLCSDKESRDILFQHGLIPELGACLERMLPSMPSIRSLWYGPINFIDMVDDALGFLDGQMEDKEEYLLHVAQHCVVLDWKWTQCKAVRTHLDPWQLEQRLVEEGPCTKCTEGSADKWPDGIFNLVRARSPTVEQDPQPDPPPAAPSTSLAASAPAVLLLTAYHPDVAPASSTPNALSAFRVEPGTIPNLPAATASGPMAPSVGSHPVIALLSVSPGYSVLLSASNSPSLLDRPSDTTPSLTILPRTATSTVPTPANVRAPEVSLTAKRDNIGTLVVSQTEPATRAEADFEHDPQSGAETAWSRAEETAPATPAPRVCNASAVSSPAESVSAGAVGALASSSVATGVSSASAHDVPAAGAATSRLVPEPSTDGAASAMNMSSSDPSAAPSQVGTASASLSEAAEDVDVVTASSVE